jgi:2-oxo-hept-3-ene-1,7-dioate hydratase
MMSPAEIRAVAEQLFKAEAKRSQIDILSLAHPDMDMDDAYAIQSALVDHKQASGRSIIGWKIGLTSKAMQYALNIDIPDSGILFDDMAFENGAHVPAGRFIQPRVEAEIAFVMSDDIAGADVLGQDIIAATAYVAPSLEILDTRIKRIDPATGKTRTVFDTIADNAANAGVVLGAEKHNITDFNLRWVGAIVHRDGEVEETGLGAGVLNDPVESMVWLVRRLARYGQGLRKGDIVLSGSFIRPIECPSGSKIDADFGAFGRVSITFD